jgi:nitrite reductase (NADH) small subunit
MAPERVQDEAVRDAVPFPAGLPEGLPEGYKPVIRCDAVPVGQVRQAFLGSIVLAVANVEGTFYAIENSCPHALGPLGEGTLSGNRVVCPQHGWAFDVTDGSCSVNPEDRVATFPAVVAGGWVCVASREGA